MIGRHARRRLSGYAHGRLPPAGRRRVEEHLAACASCRAVLDEIRFGIRLAGAIPRAPAPAGLWGSIERALDGGAGVTRPAAWRRRLVFAAPLVLLAAGFAWLARSRPELRVRHAPPALSTIERAALQEHGRRLRGGEDWGIRSGEARLLRRFVLEGTGLSASIPDARPAEDAGRLRLVGARLGHAGAARAAVIGYEVDRRPVTLVTARLSDLSDPPPEWRASKHVTYRRLAAGDLNLLVWGSDGQAYALISDLPGYGQEACIVCHTSPDRRTLIRAMRAGAD